MPDALPLAENLSSHLAAPADLALREQLGAEEAASQIIALYEEGGRAGATFNLRFGSRSAQPLFSVSLWPERSRKLSGNAVKPRVLQVFIAENLDLLDDPRAGIGLWYNVEENVTYMDIVATLPSRQEAVNLALRYDQIAIFDLQALTEIETGGTGNTPDNLPYGTDRLPKSELEEEL